ncbi:MAG: hypothetical protein ABW170_15185 [Candidatus Thiodiazotropha sp. L084R]
MGFLSSVGGMVGGVVGGMFGGPIGSQIGSKVGGGLGGMLESLIGQHGQSNVQGAMNNNMLGSLTNQLSQAIQCHPGIPQFARDEMCQALGDAQQSCPAEPTPPGCQRDTDDAMSGLIDKIVDKVVDMIMDKLQGGECESGDFGDMVRQAVEEVVREQIGGGAEDGGCATNGGAAENADSDGSSCTRTDAADSYRDSINDAATCNAENEAEESKEGKSTKGNWLVALAGALAEVQSEFLTSAMKNMETMRENSSKATQGTPPKNESPEAKEKRQKADESARNEFLMAQSHYQANMQMFNMVANMTATSLKSLGEGMTSIARKQ